MNLVYFEGRDGRAIVVVANKVVALRAQRLPTDTPTQVICVDDLMFDVRDDIDTAQQKLMAALKENGK